VANDPRRLALLLAFGLLALPLAAQIGPSRWGSEKALPFGAVNRATLDHHIEIPIYTRPTGTGVQIGLRLVYDSQFWSAAGASGPWTPAPGFGWRLAQPFGTLIHSRTIGSPYCGWYNSNTGSYDEWWNLVTDSWTFDEPDGSVPSDDYASSEYLVLGGGAKQRGDTYL
jgi:hypothetical protein